MTTPHWVPAAEALMRQATTADWFSTAAMQPLANAVGEFYIRFGDKVLISALVSWVEHAKSETRYEPGDAPLSFDPVGAGGEPLPINEIVPGHLWATRFIAAVFDGAADEQRVLVDQLFAELSAEEFSAAAVITLRITAAMVRYGEIVRDWPRPSAAPPWVVDADAVLAAAALDEWEGDTGVRGLLEALADRYGGTVVVMALERWCLHWGRRARAEAGVDATTPAFPEWRSITTGEASPAEDVAPAQRWAARYLSAVCNHDLDQQDALLGSLTTDLEFGECVLAVLEATSRPVPGAR